MGNRKTLTQAGKEIDSTEKAQKLGALGGKKSGEAKRKNKTFKEAIEFALSLEAPEDFKKKMIEAFGIKDVNLTNRDAMVLAQMSKAVKKQDTAAFNAIADRVEGKPTQLIESKKVEEKPDDDILEAVRMLEEQKNE